MSAVKLSRAAVASGSGMIPTLNGYAATVVAKLRELAPYAAIELVLPGGSLLALLLWLYRRQKKVPVLRDLLDALL
jgi:hypothetical protein